MLGDVGSWVANHGQLVGALAVVSLPAIYLVWVNRANPVYRSSHLLEFPIEAVFDAYYPRPGQDLTGHRLEGAEFLQVGRGWVEVRLRGGGVLLWEVSRPTRGAWIVGPITVIAHTFTAIDGGTRVDVEVACRFPRLWDRLTAPFMGSFHADRAREWLRERSTPQAPRTQPLPIYRQSRSTALIAAGLVAILVWYLGWVAGLALVFAFAANALGGVAAARWYGHAASSVDLLGIGNLGAPASHGEIVTKVLAGPLFGLVACAAMFAVFAVFQLTGAMSILPSVVYAHCVTLLPLTGFAGGVVVRSLTLSIGRYGRTAWTIAAGIALLAAAYLFVWQWRVWLIVPVLLLGAFAIYFERIVSDDLPKLSQAAWPQGLPPTS